MNKFSGIIRIAFLCSFLISPASHALQITNGNLVVSVREDNGAIDSYILNGIDFFEQGTDVSDWGMQLDTNTSTFAKNGTSGGESIPVDVVAISSSVAQITGSYTRGGANIEVVRTLSILPNFDALLFSYTLTNLDQFTAVTVNIFETFDPDQGQTTGNGYGTYNDVFIQGGFKIGQAVDQTGLAFIIASNDSRVIIASGNPFQINSGSSLNNVIANPYDGEGTFADSGTHLVLVATLAASEVTESAASGGVIEGNDPMDIVGQPIDDSVIDVIESTIGPGTLLSDRFSDEYIKSLEESGGTVIIEKVETEDEGAGSIGYFLVLLSLLAIYRRNNF